MKHKIIIIGQGYTGRLSIVRSVADLECDITLIVLLSKSQYESRKGKIKPIDAYSKYVNRFFFSENYNEEMLVEILLKYCVDKEQKTIIFPDNDFSAAAIDNHYDELKSFFYCPNIRSIQGSVEEWMNKVRQKTLAGQIGLNTVHAKVINVRNQYYQLPEDIHYPCFVKPLTSILGGKYGLKKCDNLIQLREHITNFMANHPRQIYDIDFLIEDYKKIDREYATLGFSDGHKVVIPGLLELLKIGHGSHFGVALQGKVFPVTGYEDLIEMFKELVKKIGFVGIFDIDYFESEGKLYFCELNLRFGGSGYAVTKMGVNLPVMMIKSFLQESIEGMKQTITGESTFFNERMAIDDWYGGHLSTKEFNKIRKESDIKFIEDETDPAPQKVLNKEFRAKRVKKTIKRWIRKK